MTIIDRVQNMLHLADGANRLFPATIFFNEGWLLRLVLDWFSRAEPNTQPISFQPGTKWFSEALLPSQFLARSREDSLAEGWTHADGVIGHVAIGQSALADVKLLPSSDQFLVTEAKLFSPLSFGVRRAPYFDQAARNVACLAEVLSRAARRPSDVHSLSFLVLAPSEQITAGVFKREMDKGSLRDKVTRRVAAYSDPSKEQWLREWFLPTLERAMVECVSWETLLGHIQATDPEFGNDLGSFYSRCLEFNRLQEREQA